MVQFSVLVSVEEEVAVEVANKIKEEIEELAVEAVAVEWVALLVMVDKVDLLEEDLDLVVDNLVEQVLKPLVEVAVAVVIMAVKQVVHLVVQVVKHLATLEQVVITTHQEDQVEETGLPLDEFRVIMLQ